MSVAENFQAAYSRVRGIIITEVENLKLPPTAVKYMETMLNYNVPGGKLTRGISVVRAFQTLREASGQPPTEDEIRKAELLGWCVELLQAFFLVADDVMDDSSTRRGQPCWFRVKNIGMKAVNDASILFSCIFVILEREFKSHPSYIRFVELFNQVCLKTQMGQLLDLESLPEGKLDLAHFKPELYKSIVIFKTAYYSFYLPVALGLLLADITDEAAFHSTEAVCIEIGEYFQIQDDFLDCYGDEATIGKIGTDIQDAKCSWLVVTALESASAAQREILANHYGQKDDASVATVKELYKELELEKAFRAFEDESYKRISAKIETITNVPKSLFVWLLATIYKRQK